MPGASAQPSSSGLTFTKPMISSSKTDVLSCMLCRFLFIMPLESNYVVINYLKPWEACFGPSEPMDLTKLQAGKKLPCFYRINQWGNYDYWCVL